jgi:hypothetical protein
MPLRNCICVQTYCSDRFVAPSIARNNQYGSFQECCIHEKTKEVIELKAVRKAANMNKYRKKVLFEPGDLVWIHLRKERFPDQRKSKLMPRGDGSFRVLAKINHNAYKIDLPPSYGVSNTFNVADLLPYMSKDTSESRTTPFQGKEDDTTTPLSNTLQLPIQTTSFQVQPTSSPT